MPAIKKRYFIPFCIAGLLAGYVAAERLMPAYFHPSSDTTLSPRSYLAALTNRPPYYRTTKSGNYLAGQHAQRNKDWAKASGYIDNVLETDPDNINLQNHAMVLAMASGDTKHAVTLAKSLSKVENDNLLSTLFTAMDDFEKENYADAIETLNQVDAESVASFIVPVLALWANAAQGKLDIENLEPNSFYAYHAMLAAKYINKNQEVIEFAEKAYDTSETDIRDLEKGADLFAQAGDFEQALKILEVIDSKGFGSDKIQQKISLLKAESPLGDLLDIQNIDTPKQGAALVFFDMAEILLREYSDDSATIFAQMALHLNPNLEDAQMILGHILARHDRYEDAIRHYKKIKSASPLYLTAQRQVADLYAEQGKDKQAITILNDLYKSHQDTESLIQVGDIYRYAEDYQEAVNTYNKVIGAPEDVKEDQWHVLYARGMSYERVKEFKKSEADLQRAIEFRPNEPFLLNYLGYSWADQGIHLNKALDMIQQAADAQPEDGYIADSLGWVYYKMQDFEAATPHLERAVELLPYDATVNDHLGDAYWRVGRKLEARFQWQRAINYSEESEADLKADIQKKLLTGLTAQAKNDIESVQQVLDTQTKPSL